MNQKQIADKVSKIEGAISKIQEDLESIKEEMPMRIETRGDPEVRMFR